MGHPLKQRFDELKVGTDIKVSWSSNPLHITELNADKELITGLHYEGTGEEFDTDPRMTRTVMFYEYEYTILDTPDLIQARTEHVLDDKTWTLCEKHYGVNYMGSEDTDPLRALAFAVLRGDENALSKMRKTLHKTHA